MIPFTDHKTLGDHFFPHIRPHLRAALVEAILDAIKNQKSKIKNPE